ncbi:hypothetical protein KC332_g1524 [Hortaea werneckii]|nr:hypothetical protein KC350_g1694 [Hortaea werneckii]KAI6995499.1 hypothetical protein KC329_g2388 [Hortaea werneckii]KAI7048023.1 hypothetical protein KC366_g2206 [Hortaea werneckii]KAI7079165.1 hypothetical protein KC327_g1382 [Hortaea werneckii]KAI7136939.1 hypothetical protein KC337_g1781 [Hortaea werneckii]
MARTTRFGVGLTGFSLCCCALLASGTDLGDYVASGIGISNSTSLGQVQGLGASPIASFAAASTGSSISKNASVDECFHSWDQWWSASSLEKSGTVIAASTYTTSYTETIIAYAGTTEVYTETLSTVSTIKDGAFAITTETIDTTSLGTLTGAPRSGYTSSNTYTGTVSSTSFGKNTLPRPTCYLPSQVSQCEQQWESWVSTQLIPAPTPPPHCDIGAGIIDGRPRPGCALRYDQQGASWSSLVSARGPPICSQASIGDALCESVRDNYVHDGNFAFKPKGADDAPYFSAGYLGTWVDARAGDFNTSCYWPTSATLGVPRCTLGCGRCAVTGGSVRLIYWPPATTTNNNSAPSTAPISAPVTAVTLGTTFTSPTLYISYSNVYAANACNDIGSTITDTIVPIPTDRQLSSVYGGTLPCDAHMRDTQAWTATAPFTIEDLYQQPVPYSIYSSQPWCATYLRDRGCGGTCPTTRPYEPILVVPEQILQDMQPAWSSCYGDIRGAYDPPIALQPATTVLGPQGPGITSQESFTVYPSPVALHSHSAIAGPEIPVDPHQADTQTATPASGPESKTLSPTATGSLAAKATVEPERPGHPSNTSGHDGDADDSAKGEDHSTSSSAENVVEPGTETTFPVDGSHNSSSESSPGDTSGNGRDAIDSSENGDPSRPSSPGSMGEAVGEKTSLAGGSHHGPSKSASSAANAAAQSQNVGGIIASLIAAGFDSDGTQSKSGPLQQASGQAGATDGEHSFGSTGPVGHIGSSTHDPDATARPMTDSGSPVSGTVAVMNPSLQPSFSLVSGQTPAASASTLTPEAFVFGSRTFSVFPTSISKEVIDLGSESFTLSAGGPATTIDGQEFSLDGSGGGIIVASGERTSTFQAMTAQDGSGPTLVVLGSRTLTASVQTNGRGVLSGPSTTLTLSPGGTTVSINGQSINQASNGAVVVQTQDEPTTVKIISGFTAPSFTNTVDISATPSITVSMPDPSSSFTSSAKRLAALQGGMLIVIAMGLLCLV